MWAAEKWLFERLKEKKTHSNENTREQILRDLKMFQKIYRGWNISKAIFNFLKKSSCFEKLWTPIIILKSLILCNSNLKDFELSYTKLQNIIFLCTHRRDNPVTVSKIKSYNLQVWFQNSRARERRSNRSVASSTLTPSLSTASTLAAWNSFLPQTNAAAQLMCAWAAQQSLANVTTSAGTNVTVRQCLDLF